MKKFIIGSLMVAGVAIPGVVIAGSVVLTIQNDSAQNFSVDQSCNTLFANQSPTVFPNGIANHTSLTLQGSVDVSNHNCFSASSTLDPQSNRLSLAWFTKSGYSKPWIRIVLESSTTKPPTLKLEAPSGYNCTGGSLSPPSLGSLLECQYAPSSPPFTIGFTDNG